MKKQPEYTVYSTFDQKPDKTASKDDVNEFKRPEKKQTQAEKEEKRARIQPSANFLISEGPSDTQVEHNTRIQPSTVLLESPATTEQIEKEAKLKQAMGLRVSSATMGEDAEDDALANEMDNDPRFLQSMKKEGPHMNRKFFKNLDSEYLM